MNWTQRDNQHLQSESGYWVFKTQHEQGPHYFAWAPEQHFFKAIGNSTTAAGAQQLCEERANLP